MTRLLSLVLVLSLWAIKPAFAAEFTLTVEPNYPPSQAQEVYKPLLDYLSKATGHTFKLKVGSNYHVHWRDLRANSKTDFAFEEAPFTDFRLDRQGFVPLVKTLEPTRFSLLADAGLTAAGVKGLIGSRIVSMPAPSLGYLLLAELYPNPLAQPEIQSVAANWRDGVEMVFAGETDGAMVPNYVAQLYPNLAAVNESLEFPGRALTASPAVPAATRKAVTDAMLKLHQNQALYEVLVELGATQFVPAVAADYAGNESMLRGVFGYVKKVVKAPVKAAEEPEAAGISVTAERGG